MTSDEYINKIYEKYTEESRIWNDVLGWENSYKFSNDGLIKSLERVIIYSNGTKQPIKERILKLNQEKHGYFIVGLSKNRKGKTYSVSRLICEAFHGPCPEGMDCLHRDSDPTNNHESNLHWGTKKENMQDMILNGTAPRGERNGNHKLTQLQVNEIRLLYATGNFTQRKLADKFNIDKSNICLIINYNLWGN